MSTQDWGGPPQSPQAGPQWPQAGPQWPQAGPQWGSPTPPPPPLGADSAGVAQSAIIAAGAALRPRPKSLAGVTAVLWLALAAEALVAVLSIAAFAWRLLIIRALSNGTYVPWSRIAASDHFVRVVAGLWMPAVIVGFVVLIIWVYEARTNLGAFRWGPFAYSQGWAIGAFLVPVANFCLPPLVVREIWKASDPALPPFAPAPFSTRPGTPMVVVWWGTFLCADLAGLIVRVLASGASQGLSTLRLVTDVRIAMSALLLAFVVLTVVIAREIARRQRVLTRYVPPPPTWAPQPVAPPWAPTARPAAWPSAPPPATPSY